MRACPKCKSENIQTERRPNGNSKCLDCDHEDATLIFDCPTTNTDQLTKEKHPIEHARTILSRHGISTMYHEDDDETYFQAFCLLIKDYEKEKSNSKFTTEQWQKTEDAYWAVKKKLDIFDNLSLKCDKAFRLLNKLDHHEKCNFRNRVGKCDCAYTEVFDLICEINDEYAKRMLP